MEQWLPLLTIRNHNCIRSSSIFEDESNTKKVIDPSYAYIIPVGADKPVKIALKVKLLLENGKTETGQKKFQVYKKLGVGAVVTNNICVYQNTSLTM